MYLRKEVSSRSSTGKHDTKAGSVREKKGWEDDGELDDVAIREGRWELWQKEWQNKTHKDEMLK